MVIYAIRTKQKKMKIIVTKEMSRVTGKKGKIFFSCNRKSKQKIKYRAHDLISTNLKKKTNGRTADHIF